MNLKITHIGAFLLIPFCSVISHTILPLPPTVMLFVISSIFLLYLISRNNYRVNCLNRFSAIPTFFSVYLFLSQIILEVDLRAIVSPCLAPLYFVITLLYLNYIDEKYISKFVKLFIYISLFVFIVECFWRLGHPKLPEGMDEINIEGRSRWIYWFKGPGLMYVETNGLAIHLVIVYFFTLWWSSLKKQRMFLVKFGFVILIILTFSRAALISVPIGWCYKYYFSKLTRNKKLAIFCFLLFLAMVLMPFVVVMLQEDPSSAEKIDVFVKIWEYYKHIDLLSLLYGIGNYNSKTAFGIYAHNYLLVFLVEMGVLGLFLLLSQFYVFIKASKGQFLFVFIPFFVQIMSSTIIFIPHFYMIAAIMIYYAGYNKKDELASVKKMSVCV